MHALKAEFFKLNDLCPMKHWLPIWYFYQEANACNNKLPRKFIDYEDSF